MKKTSIILFVATILVVFWSVSCSNLGAYESFDDSSIEADIIMEANEESQVTLEDLEKDAIFNRGIRIIVPLSETSSTDVIPTMELLSDGDYLAAPHNGVLWNILSKKGKTSILEMDREDDALYVKNIEYDSWELFVFLDNTLIQNTKGHNLCDLDQYPIVKKITEDGEIQIFLKNSSTGEIYGTGVIQ